MQTIFVWALKNRLSKIEEILNTDLEKVADYFKKWRLQPSLSTTVSSVHHLHNARANQTLKLLLNDQTIRHEPNPVYLGVTLDRTLSFREHLRETAAKVSTRNNLLGMLAGTSWGASAPTLRMSALALCYSVAEYCAPVWSRSPYTRLVDVQLNEAMRTVLGTLRPTPLPWLLVLSHIAPPHVRWKEATTKLLAKIRGNDSFTQTSRIILQPVCHHGIQYGWMFLGKSGQLLMNGVMNGWLLM